MITDSLFFKALESTRDGLVITEFKGGQNLICYVNPAFEKLTGYDISECVGQDCRFLQGTAMDQPEIRQISEAIKRGESILVTLKNYKKDGSLFWNELSVSPIKNSTGEITHFVGIQKDVTERVNLQQQLSFANDQLKETNKHLVTENKIDRLTGLYNRKALDDDAQIFINIAQRQKSALALYFIDIDNFKSINDQYGHEVGDICLQYVADHLLKVFKRSQDLVIRYGGEEFLVLSYGTLEEDFDRLANELVKVVSEDEVVVSEKNIKLAVTVSIGVSRASVTADFDISRAIEKADIAMYNAKKNGKNQVAFCCQLD